LAFDRDGDVGVNAVALGIELGPSLLEDSFGGMGDEGVMQGSLTVSFESFLTWNYRISNQVSVSMVMHEKSSRLVHSTGEAPPALDFVGDPIAGALVSFCTHTAMSLKYNRLAAVYP
jgi:hypothetical protein